MNKGTLVSIIIPTFNGRQRLPRLLDSITYQTNKQFEIIVVIDGSTDDSLEFLNKNDWPYDLRVVKYSNAGRGTSRNRGASLAKGAILYFVDDDIEMAPTTLEKHLETLRDHGAEISGGAALEPIEISAEFGKFKAWLTRKWLQNLASSITLLDKDNTFLSSANLAITKDAFNRLGGFDENLTDAEDFDLAVRAVILDMKVVYDRSNTVVHHSFDSCVEYVHRQREYRKAHRKLVNLRRGSPDEELFTNYSIKKKPILKILYALVPGSTASWVDKRLFRFLPRKARYSIYLRIISALGMYYPHKNL